MQGLPPGFVLDGQPSQAPAPAPSAPGIIRGRPAPPAIPSGYETDGRGGLRPIPGGPADKPESDPNGPKLPTGYMWKDGIVGGEAVLIRGVPAPKGSTSGSLDPKTTEGQANIAKNVLAAAGVTGDKDPVAELIQGSTSGTLQRLGADAYGAITGQATDGMENIGKLETIANDMVLQMSGGSLGAQISDGDRKFIAARMGDIGNPDLPANQRIAAWEQVKERLFTLSGVQPAAPREGPGVEDELRQKYPDAADFQYGKNGELLGYYDANGEFVLLYGPQGPQGPNDPNGGGLGDALYAGLGDVAQFAGNTVGLIGNPLNTGINAIAGTDLSTDLGQTFRDATGAPEGNSLASAINQGGLSALTGLGIANAARPLVQGTSQAVVNSLLQQPLQQVAGGISAGASADLARQAGAPAPVQMAAGFAGGLGGFSGTNALMRAAQPKTLSPVAQAAQRQGVDLLPAQTGGTGTRIATAGGRQGFISEIPIAKAVDRQQGQLENVRSRAADAAGVAMDKEDAGELVRKAANIFSKKTGETGAALYTRARQRAAGVTASLDNAIAVIDEELAGIAQAPGGKDTALYKELEGLKKNMAGGKFSIEGIRNMRTTLREEADFKGIRGSNTNRIYNRVVNAASDDMMNALRAAGKDDAAAAFKTADDFWKKRVETIDEVLEPLLGKNTQRSGEQILSTLERLGNAETGNAANLRRLMNALPENEARNIRATVIDRLGKPTPGQQTDNTFSLDKFLTDYNKLSGKAKSILFTGESRRALDDLAKIAAADKKAGRFLNTSNTARAVGVQAAVTGGAGLLLNPIVAGLMAGGQFAFGKLLASPKFATWLAKVPANPQAMQAHIKRLDSIAAAEPIIANDIASIKQFLANAPTSARAAAAEGDDVGEERPIKP